MSRYHSYLNSAGKILASYKGEEPLASFLKKFFAANKKYGSADRKQISHLCYCYFRLGKALTTIPVEERLLIALFLCSTTPDKLLEAIRPEWNTLVSAGIEEKCRIMNIDPTALIIFPWTAALSKDIDPEKFNQSFFIQPDLFIRVRPGHEKKIIPRLEESRIPFHSISSSCISFPNGSKIEDVIDLDKEAVIQDRSSQQVADFLPWPEHSSVIQVWDCCAASGGKSIMAKDVLVNIDLAVSDIRESILLNLRKRFFDAGIKRYRNFVIDLADTRSAINIPYSPFDLIIADVPCTGSGTWGRTPEQLFYFEEKKTGEYAERQKNIVSNVIPALKPGGWFLYITCSVFKKENEDIIAFIKEKQPVEIIKMELIKGYDQKADTMFAALLQKPL